jgi:hypothetical protein
VHRTTDAGSLRHGVGELEAIAKDDIIVSHRRSSSSDSK